MTILLATLTLAQTSAEKNPARIFLVIGLLMATVLALGLVIMALRKRLLTKESEQHGTGSILEDIRAMRTRGEISDEEYHAMRQRIIRKMSPSSGAGLSVGGSGADAPINTSRPSRPAKIGRVGDGKTATENPDPRSGAVPPGSDGSPESGKGPGPVG